MNSPRRILSAIALILSGFVAASTTPLCYAGQGQAPGGQAPGGQAAGGQAAGGQAPGGQPQSGPPPQTKPADGGQTSPGQGGGVTGGAPTNGGQSQTGATKSTENAEPMVHDVYLFGHPDANDKDRNSAAIDDLIVVQVTALQKLLTLSRCVDETGKAVANCTERPLTLFIDGTELKKIQADAVDVNTGNLIFHLKRTEDNTDAWANLLGAPPLGRYFFERPSKISIGLDGESPIPSSVKNFMIERIDKAWFAIGALLIGLMIFTLYQLSRRSDLLRASGPPPVDANGNKLPKAYSLARFQMAFWFVLVIIAYVFIWLITSANDTISGSVLALIGIGSGTALGAAAVDASKNQPASASEDFLKDILSDPDGICFHRFQMFVWTIVLGIMFVSSVYYDLAMPEFSATLLGMQGISAGTYLGFKIPEN